MKEVYNNDILSRIKGVETYPEINPPTMSVLISDGRTIGLRAEQIPMFLHSGVKSGAIGKELAEKIVSDFKDLIPMVAVTDVTTQEQLDVVYDGLDKAIKAKLSESQKNGKKLLIVVGEDHDEKRSSLAEFMIINIAKDLGIKNLITETTPQLLQTIKSIPIDSIKTPNFSTVLKVAEARGMMLHNGDPEQYNPILNVRKEAMNKAVAEIDDSGVMIVGLLHLPDILEDVTLQSQYEILAINASCIEPEKKTQLYRSYSYPKEALEYALSSDNALQVSFPGNPYKLSPTEMLEMSFIARECVTGNKKSKSEVESKVPLVTSLQSVVEFFTKSPGVTMEIVTKPLSEKELTMMERMSNPIVKDLNKDRIIFDTSMLSNNGLFDKIIKRAKNKVVQELLTSGNLHVSEVLYSEDERFLKVVERLQHPIIQVINQREILIDSSALSNDEKFERTINRAKPALFMFVQGKIHISHLLHAEDTKFMEYCNQEKEAFIKESSESLSRLNARLEQFPADVEARLERANWLIGNAEYKKAAIDAGYVLKNYPVQQQAQKLMKVINLLMEEVKEEPVNVPKDNSELIQLSSRKFKPVTSESAIGRLNLNKTKDSPERKL